MLTHFALESLHLKNSRVTIGSFDGVHLGHQTVIRQTVDSAHSVGAQAVVITFSPHPAVILRGITGPFYLTSFEQKSQIIQSLGVDHLITLPFNQTLSKLTARKFMELLVKHLGMRELIVGFDFKVGFNRQGTPAVLSEIGKELGFEVITLPPQHLEGLETSSSRIRTLLTQGNVSQAKLLLGRPYTLGGEVVEGDGRGRQIGFPTANIAIPPELLIPLRGVYATRAYLGVRDFYSLTNVGLRPTFHQRSKLSVETHILDFDEMIYHQNLKIEFISFLRSEHRFLSTRELTAQIEQDIFDARKAFDHAI